MGRFNIDGRSFSGRSVIVHGDGRIVIDGKPVDGTVHGVVEIKVTEGTIENLTSEMNVTAANVTGNVRAGMSVTCEDVGGNVNAGMSVTCGKVSGDVDAGMGVTMRRG